MVQITEFLGTCSSQVIGDFALRYGRTVSYKYALKLIKNFDITLYQSLMPEFYNPWNDNTNIKKVNGERFLHIVHSAVDYIFKLEKL